MQRIIVTLIVYASIFIVVGCSTTINFDFANMLSTHNSCSAPPPPPPPPSNGSCPPPTPAANCSSPCYASGCDVSILPPLVFPTDHYEHGTTREWWYFSGEVSPQNNASKIYSFFYTFFKNPDSPDEALVLGSIIDVESGERLINYEFYAPWSIGVTVSRNPFSLVFDNSPLAGVPGIVVGRSTLTYLEEGESWNFAVEGADFSLSFTLNATKGYVLHGNNTGYISERSAGCSAYYSATTLNVQGEFNLVNSSSSSSSYQVVNGDGWMDRQWGYWTLDWSLYDWFSFRFSDGTRLMLYAFLTDNQQPWYCYYTGTYVRADGSSYEVRDFTVESMPPYYQPVGQSIAYIVNWRVSVEEIGLTVTMTDSQDNSYANFWEGPTTFTVVSGNPVGGYVFTEQARPILTNLTVNAYPKLIY